MFNLQNEQDDLESLSIEHLGRKEQIIRTIKKCEENGNPIPRGIQALLRGGSNFSDALLDQALFLMDEVQRLNDIVINQCNIVEEEIKKDESKQPRGVIIAGAMSDEEQKRYIRLPHDAQRGKSKWD